MANVEASNMVHTVSLEVSRDDETQHDSDQKPSVRKFESKKNTWTKDLTNSDASNLSYWGFFYALLITIISSFFSSGITLIPQHNTIEHPEYWYETIISQAMAHNVWVTSITVLRLRIFFKDVDCLRTPTAILKLYLATHHFFLLVNNAGAVLH